jgi:hypothetical protein
MRCHWEIANRILNTKISAKDELLPPDVPRNPGKDVEDNNGEQTINVFRGRVR